MCFLVCILNEIGVDLYIKGYNVYLINLYDLSELVLGSTELFVHLVFVIVDHHSNRNLKCVDVYYVSRELIK